MGTDLWFARRIVNEHGKDLRHVGKWGRWYAYDEAAGRWFEDCTGEAMRRAKSTATQLLKSAAERLMLASECGDRDKIEEAQKLVSTARRFYGRGPLEGAVKLASSEPEVIAEPETWDRDEMLLSVANGMVVDLATGKARKARRGDYLTKGSPARYDANAEAPVWRSFLERVLPDTGVRMYMQRALGLCLTGHATEHVLHVLCGNGANGKSTLLNILLHVLGDYAVSVPASMLMARRGEQHPTVLASLHGKRLAVASETPEGGRLAEERLKSLTGGDRIAARRMREDFWSFDPTHKLFLATNYRPKISGTDQGIWRRIRLIPFEVQIPPAERDPGLGAALQREAGGILRWMVEGCMRYQRDGLQPPAQVETATAEYQTEEDDLGAWLSDCVVAAEGSFVQSKILYRSYAAWCEGEGIPERQRIQQRTLTKRLKARGFTATNYPHRGFSGLEVRTGAGGCGS